MHLRFIFFLADFMCLYQILEPCSNSIAYQPPNPWTMGILGLLAEIYAMPNLKMNLKFEIEVILYTHTILFFARCAQFFNLGIFS